MKSISKQTGDFLLVSAGAFAHLDPPPQCPGRLLWVRGGAGSCLTSLTRCILASVTLEAAQTEGEGPSQPRYRPGDSGSETHCPGSQGSLGQQGTGTPSPPCCPAAPASGESGVGLGPAPPRPTPVWSLQGSAATRSARSCTSTPSPRSRTARGTTAASASTVGVRWQGPRPGDRPPRLCARPACSYTHCVRPLGAGEALSHPQVPPQARCPWTASLPGFLTRRLVFKTLCVLPAGPAEHEAEPASEAVFAL